MLNRRTVLATGAIAAVPLTTSLGALAQGRKDAVTLAMTPSIGAVTAKAYSLPLCRPFSSMSKKL